MDIQEILKDNDITSYLRAIIDPSNLVHIPDDQLTPSTLKSDTYDLPISVPTPFNPASTPQIKIEFYPNTVNAIFGAVYVTSGTANGWAFVANLTRTNPLETNYGWARALAKRLKLKMNTRAGGTFDISGQIAGIESQANVEQFYDKITLQMLPGVVSDPYKKVCADITEGIVALAIPTEFDNPFRKIQDVVTSVPGTTIGVGGSNFYANNVDYTRSNAVRGLERKFLNVNAGTSIFFEQTIRMSGLTAPRVAVTFSKTQTTLPGTAAYFSFSVSIQDINDVVIRSVTLGTTNVSFIGTSVDTFMNQLPQDTVINDPLRRPWHSIRIIGTVTATVAAGYDATTSVEITVPGGSNTGDQCPVQVFIVDNLEAGSKVDLNVAYLDEAIPNAGLQSETVPTTTEVNWAAKKLVELFAANGGQFGFKPLMTTTEYEELLANVRSLELDPAEVEAVMHASTGRKLRGFLKGVLRYARQARKLTPMMNMIDPRLGYLTDRTADFADAVPMRASTTVRLNRRGNFAAADSDSLPKRKRTSDDDFDDEWQVLRPEDYDSAVPFVAVNEVDDKINGQVFLAIRGLKTELVQRKYVKQKGGKHVFNYMEPGIPVDHDITLVLGRNLSGENPEILINKVVPITGGSVKAALRLVDTGEFKQPFKAAITGNLSSNLKDIKPVSYAKAKSFAAQREGLILLHNNPEHVEGARRVPSVGKAKLLLRSNIAVNDELPAFVKKYYDGVWRASDDEYDTYEKPQKAKLRRAGHFAPPPKVDPKQTVEETWENNYNTVLNNVNKCFEANETEEKLDFYGELNSAKLAFIQELMSFAQDIVDKCESPEDIEYQNKTFGSMVYQYATTGATLGTTTTPTPYAKNSMEKVFNWITGYMNVPLEWKTLSEKQKEKFMQTGKFFSNYDIQLVTSRVPIRPEMIEDAKEQRSETWGNLIYQGNVYRLAKECSSRGIPWSSVGEDSPLIEILEYSYEKPLTKELNLELSKLSGAKKKPELVDTSPAGVLNTVGLSSLASFGKAKELAKEFTALKKEVTQKNFLTFLTEKGTTAEELRKEHSKYKDEAKKTRLTAPQPQKSASGVNDTGGRLTRMRMLAIANKPLTQVLQKEEDF